MENNSLDELYKAGQRCLNLGNPKEALTYFDRILRIDSSHTQALVKKGNILGKLGKYKELVAIYDGAYSRA